MQEQAYKLRAQFRDRYDDLKVKIARNERLKKLKVSFVVLRANVKQKKEER